jgi:hypothetical protein
MLGSLIGCSPEPSQPVVQTPVVIVVRNNCGVDLRTVSLYGLARPDGSVDSYGTISPVPRGTTQILGRQSAAFPLPNIVELVWTDDREQQYRRKIAMERLLRQAPGQDKKTLIFEIRPAGESVAYPREP